MIKYNTKHKGKTGHNGVEWDFFARFPAFNSKKYTLQFDMKLDIGFFAIFLPTPNKRVGRGSLVMNIFRDFV